MSDHSLHGALDAVATRSPERTALVAGPERVSYGELRRRADALAVRLTDRGVGREDRVAVHLERSVDLVVAMVGVLRAGAVCVPVAPEYPPERTTFLLGDSQAVAVVTERPGPTFHDVPVVPVNGEPAERDPARGVPVPGDAAAYVIYTSGSTGRPKGVVVTHANALGLVQGQDYVRFGPEETFLQLSPVSFDASAFEIWGALAHGARLVLPGSTYRAIEDLPQIIREHRVTTLFLTPALFHELVQSKVEVLDGVRQVVVGGDVLSPSHSARFLRHTARQDPPAVLVNGYGPTETTTFATTHTVTLQDTTEDRLPIGRPLKGVRAYVLDEVLRPVPTGERGQLYLAGRGVTRGYAHHPGLTASAFVPDPWAEAPGDRMYRTGDLARVRPDGALEYLGRVDDQVKVRGFRVEPGEVEAALSALPRVRQAAVVAREDPEGGKQLVAFVVPHQGGDADATEVRAKLAERLPAYLVPSRVVFADALALTPSGKVDRRALAEPGAEPSRPDTPTADPHDPVGHNQTVLAQVWAEVLGVEHVGPDDDFFALGGDSMLAIRAVADAEERGVVVSLADMFQHPVLREVCPPDEAPADPPSPGTPHEASPDDGPHDGEKPPAGCEASYPATRLQLGLIYEAVASPGQALYHDVMAHRVHARLDEPALRAALDCVARAHEVLRTRFDIGAMGGPRQLVEHAPSLPLTVVDLTEAGEDALDTEIERLAKEAGRPFDVTRAPLMRVYAARESHDTFRLLYGFHHAIMDGWSDTVFLTDLMDAYATALAGHEPMPRQPALRYEEFVHLEQRARESEESREFWRQRCRGLQPTLLAPRTTAPGAHRLRVARTLPTGLREALVALSAQVRVPLKSLVGAAHLAVVAELAGTRQPVVGLPVNGRPEATGADGLVGLFLNIVPLSASLDGASWEELARRVFDAERQATPHRRFPLQEIREQAGGPLFDVLLNFAHFRLWAGLSEERPDRTGGPIRVDGTRMWDKTSYPLVVDVVVDAVGEGLRIDVTGDTAWWDSAGLERVWDLHRDALAACVADPTGPVV
ncbi:amino acid adenylation domain-containing protein [Streptomyces sp. NPDC005438]|uniref:non-ribosomal peptide synthetase n=1 Tax=Streptomyces sp. NPDC005438 TaxID=3156880 RepID=UPI0033A26F1C